MTANFRAFKKSDLADCLVIFDENCPEFFAANERTEYQEFLESAPNGYLVCMSGSKLIGACGLIKRDIGTHHLNWILISNAFQGHGIGRQMVAEIKDRARRQNVTEILIAASHRSEAFFGKFGAIALRRIENGWGPGMHKIEMKLSL